MFDFHSHTLLSDGELIPSELARRAAVKGYEVLGITDHVDSSNVDFVVERILTATRELGDKFGVQVIPGVEITHVPPQDIAAMVRYTRAQGIRLVLVHGETLSEPVITGTNRAAIEAGVTILAHPGLITPEEVAMAAERGVYLELSCRKGHCLANGHVAALAQAAGCALVVDSDSHAPGDLVSREQALRIARGAGLSEAAARTVIYDTVREITQSLLK